MTTIEIITSIFILIGVFFTLISGLGIIRLRDVYTRLHAAGKSSTFGVMSMMLAVFIYFLAQGELSIKILLSILFVFMTAPLSALVISRTAYKIGVPLEENSVGDDLKEKYETEKRELEKQ